MEVYLKAFVNLEGKNWAVVEPAYNNAKDASTSSNRTSSSVLEYFRRGFRCQVEVYIC